MNSFVSKAMTVSILSNHVLLRKIILNKHAVLMKHMSTAGMFKDPRLDLQELLDVPLQRVGNIYFNPSVEAMNSSLQLFVPKVTNTITKLCNAVRPDKFPSHNLPEISFLGRSNSGKSSLLKAIFNDMPELRIQTSKKPGHTRSLKFYQVGAHLCLVDMPGYGYRQPKWFESSVIHYLKNRRNLVKTFILIDSTQSFHDWDDATLQMLADIKVPFAIVLTKIDAVADSQRLKNLLHITNIMKTFPVNTCFPQVFMLSSHTNEGLAYFISFIAHITGNLNMHES